LCNIYCAKLGEIRLPLILLGIFATHCAPLPSLQVIKKYIKEKYYYNIICLDIALLKIALYVQDII
jgi:hypothetical protein